LEINIKGFPFFIKKSYLAAKLIKKWEKCLILP